MEKKLNFKKLLATASAFAVIAGASNSAMGAVKTTGGNEALNAGGTWVPAGAPANNDSIRIDANGRTLDADAAGRIIAAYDNAGFNPGDITVTNSFSLGSVGGAGNAVNVTFGAVGQTLTLTGTAGGAILANDYTGLGNIDFANKNTATLTINNAAGVETVLAGNAANVDANSILNVQTDLKVNQTFAPIGQVSITDGKTLHINAGANNVAPAGGANWKFLGNDSRLKFTVDTGAAAKAIVFAAAFDPVGGAADDKGILEVVNTGAANLLTLDGGGADIGNANNHRLREFVTGGVGAIKIDNNSIFAKKISINGTGQVNFDDALDSGADSILTFGDDGDVLFSDNATVATIDFNGKNAKVNVAAGKAITGDVTTTVNNTGNLVFAQAGQVVGTIGAKDLALKTVEVTGAGAVALNGTAHYAETFKFGNAAAQLTIADNGSLHGNAAGNGVIQFDANGEFVGTAHNLVSVIANGNGVVTIGAGDHVVTTFKAADANAQFNFADGANIDGAIDNTSGGVNATKLNFAGGSTVTGNIGNANAFNEVNIGGGTVAIVADLKATNVNFADSEDSILQIQGNAAHTITGKISANGNKGTIKIAGDVLANNVTFASAIGDHAAAGKKLKLLEIANGFTGEVRLDANTHITDVQIGGGSIRLNANNYKFGGITSTNGGGNGTLLVNANNANLVGRAALGDAVINLGTSESRLAKLEFAGDNTLNIEDGVNIHVNTFDNGGNNHGKLVFEGTSIFEANALAAANHKLNTITLNANANVTILSPNTNANGVTKLGDGSTLAIAGNFTGAIDGVAVDKAVVRFINTAATKLTGAVGGGFSLKTIEFAGSDVEFVGQVTHTANNAFVFSGDTASTVKFDNATDVGNNVFTNESATTNTVVLALANTEFKQNLATSVDNQLNFQLGNGVDAKITGGDATGTNFTTDTDKQGALELNKADLVINSAGEFNKSVAKVDFTNSATITNNTYAEEVQVVAGKTAILGGTIKSDHFHLDGIAAKTVFSDGATVDSIIKTTVAGKGLVEFAGGATISQNLGVDAANALNTVTFADNADKTALLGANIYATNIVMRQGVVKLTSNAELNGVTNATATTFDLEDKKLVANGNLTFNGANKIKFSTTNAGSDLTGGQITIAAGKNVVFAAGTALAITANDKGNARPTGGGSHDFTLIDGDVLAVAGNKLDISKVTVGNTNKFTSWTAAIGENNRLILTQIDNAAGALKKILGAKVDAADNANIDALANAALNTEGYKVVTLLSTLTDNAAKTEEVFDRLSPVVADAIEDTVADVAAALSIRAISLAGSQGNSVQTRTVSSERVVGVSAGDDHARFGAWFSPFYNNTTQKARKGAAGYKGESYGASFGFDTRTNEDVIIGAAFTAANSELKHKNFKSGDKTKVNSLLFSIYGMHQITDTWFALGSATVGTNEIRNSERKVSGLNSYEIANAKYSSMSFSSEVMFGYNHITEQATITPMGGLRYTRVNDGGYKETGTAFQNLDVSTKASNKFEVILGARANGGTFDLNGLSVTPEVHAFINHDLINKNPKQSIKLGSTTLTAKSRKPVRTTYNLGLGANAEFGMMEYGASYDAQLANKRVGHQGTLRLRVNF